MTGMIFVLTALISKKTKDKKQKKKPWIILRKYKFKTCYYQLVNSH